MAFLLRQDELFLEMCIRDRCTPANSKMETAAVINPDCPVCSAEHADLTLCIGTEAVSYTHLSNKNIYANGLELKLEEGALENYTRVSYRAMDSENEYVPFEVTGAEGNITDGYILTAYSVFGSGKAASTGKTKIIMTGGNVNKIYGGGGSNALVVGSTEVIINGGELGTSVYGCLLYTSRCV